LGIWYLYHHT